MTVYLLIKLIHILAAIVAIGLNLSYPLLLRASGREQHNMLFALQSIKKMDTWFANPGYITSLVTGLLLVHFGNLSIQNTLWILYALLLFSLMGFLAFYYYSPLLSKQIKVLKTSGIDSDAFQKLDQKQRKLGAILIAIAIFIVFLMTVKPF